MVTAVMADADSAPATTPSKDHLKRSPSSKKKKGKTTEMDAEQHSTVSKKKKKTKKTKKSKDATASKTKSRRRKIQDDGSSQSSTKGTSTASSTVLSWSHKDREQPSSTSSLKLVGMMVESATKDSSQKKKKKSKKKTTKDASTTKKKTRRSKSKDPSHKKQKKTGPSKKERVAQIMAAHKDAMKEHPATTCELSQSQQPTSTTSTATTTVASSLENNSDERSPQSMASLARPKIHKPQKSSSSSSVSSKVKKKKKSKSTKTVSKKQPSPAETPAEPVGTTQSPKPPVALVPLSFTSNHSPKSIHVSQRRWTMSPGTPTRRMSATGNTNSMTSNTSAPFMPLLQQPSSHSTGGTSNSTTRPRRWSLISTGKVKSENTTFARRNAFRLGRSHSWNSQLAANKQSKPLPFPENDLPLARAHKMFARSNSDSRLHVQPPQDDHDAVETEYATDHDEPLWNAEESWAMTTTTPLRPRIQQRKSISHNDLNRGSDHDSMECAPDELMELFSNSAFAAHTETAGSYDKSSSGLDESKSTNRSTLHTIDSTTQAGDLDALMRTTSSSGSPLLDDLISSFDANKSTSSAFTNGTQELTQSSGCSDSLEEVIRECPPVVVSSPSRKKSCKKTIKKKKGLLMSKDSMAVCSSQLLDKKGSTATSNEGGEKKRRVRKVKRDGSGIPKASRPPLPDKKARRRMSSKELSDFVSVQPETTCKSSESKETNDFSSSANSFFFDISAENADDGSFVSQSNSTASDISKRFDDSFASFTSSMENSSTFEDCQAQVEEEDARLDTAMNKIQRLFLQQRQKERTKRLEESKERIRRRQAEKRRRRERAIMDEQTMKRLLVLEWFRQLGMPRKGAFRKQIKRMGADFCGISEDDVDVLKWGINGLIDPRELSASESAKQIQVAVQ